MRLSRLLSVTLGLTTRTASLEAKVARLSKEADEHRQQGTAKDQEALSKAQALITLAASAVRPLHETQLFELDVMHSLCLPS